MFVSKNHIHPSSLLCNGNFLLIFIFYIGFSWYLHEISILFSEDLQKEIVQLFSDILFYWYISLKINFLSHYLLLTPVLPFSSCGFQITLSVFFLAPWTDSMLSSLFILSAFVHFLSFLCFIFMLLLLIYSRWLLEFLVIHFTVVSFTVGEIKEIKLRMMTESFF